MPFVSTNREKNLEADLSGHGPSRDRPDHIPRSSLEPRAGDRELQTGARPDDRSITSATKPTGILYVVATPIGNLQDFSPRAKQTLAEVDLIACEDTRHTAQLLSACDVHTPSISYFEHNEERRIPGLIERLKQGTDIALVSDAGTPAISDPGYRLVAAALNAGIRVVAIPGPSAAIAALSISGLPTDRFAFEGFLPARDGRRLQHLKSLQHETRTMIFYEATRRLADTLEAISEVFGADRKAAIVREITKTFEQTVFGPIGELVARIAAMEPRGEITLVVAGAASIPPENEPPTATITVELLREAGLSHKQASAVIAKLTGASRREIYQRALNHRTPAEPGDA
jgi:16S rRNA (cytidine1402-2'-O)-methyltransferase